MIRLTRLADYSVVVMTHIAYEPHAVHAAGDVADVTHLPAPTVSKIMGAMARAGLLQSHRGLKGGFSLGKRAAEITVGEIIAAVDGPIAITDCVGEGPADCALETICPTRGHWQKINGAIREALDGVTLDDLVQPQPYAPLAAGSLAKPMNEQSDV